MYRLETMPPFQLMYVCMTPTENTHTHQHGGEVQQGLVRAEAPIGESGKQRWKRRLVVDDVRALFQNNLISPTVETQVVSVSKRATKKHKLSVSDERREPDVGNGKRQQSQHLLSPERSHVFLGLSYACSWERQKVGPP